MMYYHAKEGNPMKIVVVRSPKLLAGIFRLMFHIKKEEEATE